MDQLDALEMLFIAWGFLFQIILIVHFGLRKWRFKTAMKYGWVVYALGAVAAAFSLVFLSAGKPWWLWLGGFLYLAWAVFSYWVEYIRKIQWRKSVQSPIFWMYLFLYLATVMFYWWPIGMLYKPLWYI